MREFRSCRDFGKFARSVKFRSRYILEPDAQEFFETVMETATSRMDTLTAGSILFRAQVGHDWRKEPCDPNQPEGDFFEVPHPFEPKRMKPLKDSAREGRVNPKGIPCLYLSSDVDTAMAETRPWIDSKISLGQFKILEDLPILKLPEAKLYTKFFFNPPHDGETEPPPEREKAVWGEIAYAFSEPITASDMTADYAPTQYLAETFRKIGCAGILYKSRLGEGSSLAIFDPNKADLMNCRVFNTHSLKFNFDEDGGHYFVTKYYPELSK
jgi:RES domain-containing protein